MATRMDHAPSPTSPTGPSFAPVRPAFPPRSSSMRMLATTSAAAAAAAASAPASAHSPDTPGVMLEPSPGQTWAAFLRTWSDAHVAQWLQDIRCPALAHTFATNDLRGDVLLELDAGTLKELAVGLGDRLRVSNALKVLRAKCASRAVSAPPAPAQTSSHSRTPSASDPSGDRPSARRLEAGRPAPLMIPPGSTRVIAEGADSARFPRSLPFPSATPTTATPSSTAGSTPSTSSARGQASGGRNGPPGPRNRNLVNYSGGYRTPTQAELMAYNQTPLPPAPAPPAYGLPSDPRPGNLGGGVRTPVRANSPLHSVGGTHARSGSAGAGPQSGAGPSKLPPRGPSSHPYAAASALQPPAAGSLAALSPIQERFDAAPSPGGPSPPLGAGGVRAGNRPTTPGAGPTLEDLRRKLVKFVVPDFSGRPSSTHTLSVPDGASGAQVLEKALEKARLLAGGDYSQTGSGGLVLDGWAAFIEMEDPDQYPHALTEDELLRVCHAPAHDPIKQRGLTLRRVVQKPRRPPAYDALGRQSPTSPRFPGEPESAAGGAPERPTMPMNMRRASSISILSGLGVPDPERVLAPPMSPTQAAPPTPTRVAYTDADAPAPAPEPVVGLGPPPTSASAAKVRNFLGQRPPSELITTHLHSYFPSAAPRVLERTRRISMMRPPGTRTSVASFATGTSALPGKRFSVSTAASAPRPSSPGSVLSGGDAPRVSLSTEDGRSIDLHSDAPHLPPVAGSGESLERSLEGLARELERPGSSLSAQRLSYITELRSHRDQSDTASMMTVDQITAEVESRRASTLVEGDSPDGWTKVDELSDAGDTRVDETESASEAETTEDEEEEEDDEVHGGGKWIKGALIGSGSFGQVYLGMDAATGLLMAVKQVELPKEDTPNAERKKSMLTALELEIELLQDLRHEHIVQYLYSSTDDQYLNIFLEYVPGGSITALLRNYGSFEETLVKTFLRQILKGLEYLHAKDIIHRDIKGANILVDNKGTVKISDFGISKKGGAALAGGGRANKLSLQGSVFWMAPEVVKQTAHTPKSDIWSVGCLLVEMFTGEHPWPSLTQMQAIFKIGSGKAKPTTPPDISTEAAQFIDVALDYNFEQRPTAVECLQHPWLAPPSKRGGSKTKASLVDS